MGPALAPSMTAKAVLTHAYPAPLWLSIGPKVTTFATIALKTALVVLKTIIFG